MKLNIIYIIAFIIVNFFAEMLKDSLGRVYALPFIFSQMILNGLLLYNVFKTKVKKPKLLMIGLIVFTLYSIGAYIYVMFRDNLF